MERIFVVYRGKKRKLEIIDIKGLHSMRVMNKLDTMRKEGRSEVQNWCEKKDKLQCEQFFLCSLIQWNKGARIR